MSDGWLPDERCRCDEPDPVFYAGHGYYLNNVCLACRRRVRQEQLTWKEDE